MNCIDWGCIDYLQSWEQQTSLFQTLIERKKNEQPTSHLETVVFCEHPHVYTLGKSGDDHNLLVNDDFLKTVNATFVKIDRGGDITYHGPGQIVGYPILDLENHNLSLKNYIHKMEEAIILTLQNFGIDATRLNGATGVWIDAMNANARKICAIGVKASRFVTMHGFALNVNADLQYFNYINPCGFVNKGVTSMQKELGHEINIYEVKSQLQNNLLKFFTE
jgi:lipoyl(octanoyl) transferase